MWKKPQFLQTSFSRPLVNDGDKMLRILFQFSSSTTDTASRSGPFRPKSLVQNEKLLFYWFYFSLVSLVQQEEPKQLSTHPPVGENGVTLLHQDGFDHRRVSDAQHRLPSIV